MAVPCDTPPRAVDERDGDTKLRIAVLDLGSTSFHLLVADAKGTGEIHRVSRRREMLRLGAAISDSGRIRKEVRTRAVRAADTLRLHAEGFGVDRLVAVGTAAMRDARNGLDMRRQIEDALGQSIRILSGEEEARLIFAAFRQRRALPDGPTLGLDLGGGSLELAIGDAYEVHWETTLPIGVTRLHGELAPSDPMRRRELKAVRRRVREALEPHVDEIAARAAGACIACGGTARALWRLVAGWRGAGAHDGDPLHVSGEELTALRKRLVEASHDQRLQMHGMKRRRADLLPTGAIVLETVVERLELEGFEVSDWGLREGVILEALGLADSRGRKTA